MNLKRIGSQLQLVTPVAQVVGSRQVQGAFMLLQVQRSRASITLHGQTGTQLHAVRNDQGAVWHQSAQSGQEVQVARLHLQVQIAAARQAVRQVPEFTPAAERERSGQVHGKAADLHLFQIALRAGTDYQRMERIGLLETLRQATGQQQHVLLADTGIQTGGQTARSGDIDEFPISLCGQINLAVRGGQLQEGDTYQGGVGRQTPRQ